MTVRYTAGMVWFNEQRDEWLQMRQTVMKIAPVSTATDVNNLSSDNEPSLVAAEQQQQQQEENEEEEITDVTETEIAAAG